MVKDYKGLGYSLLRFFPQELRQKIREKDLWEDLRQEIDLASFLAEKDKMDLKEASKFIQKSIYRFLVNYGFKRSRKEDYKYITEEFFSDITYMTKEVLDV